mmetsp:Transcript_56392/g.50724  ORF Transcript_56392/g.50724 Transcript_56392/m.50724 type:complete len:153 (+) Transcript_56392:113-571(+)
MPKKRKNGGKNRHNRGIVGFVRCDVSGRAVPKDKAIKRFIVRNLVDPSGQKDLKDASYYDKYQVPKMYYKACYCVSAAIHQRIVRPRNRQERKNRNPPPEVLKRWAKEAKRQREREKQAIAYRKRRQQNRNRQGGQQNRGGRGGGGGGRRRY